MCNACGFICCASDEFDGCGCNFCECPACWSEDDDDFDDDPSAYDEDGSLRASAPPRAES